MRIYDYLDENMVLMDLKSADKESAVKELAELMKGSGSIPDFKGFIDAVFEREKMYTTGIGNEVALPHARTDSVKNFVIAFGRSAQGIEFNSIDKKKVKLVFLMGTPLSSDIKNYLFVLAHLNRLLQKKSFRDSLISAESYGELIEIFKTVEDL